jgi:serine protease
MTGESNSGVHMGESVQVSVHGRGHHRRRCGLGQLGLAQLRVGMLAALLFAGLIMSNVHASEGPPQQIIIKWRDAPSPAAQKTWTDNTLREAGARQGVKLQFVRTMGTGANVYKLEPALAARELDALIKSLTGDPHVEYAEADSMMRTMPRN